MIIIGYPGVGKTVAASKFVEVIDFDLGLNHYHIDIAYIYLLFPY